MHCVPCAGDAEWGSRKDKLPRHYAEHGQAFLIRELFIPDPGADLVASDARQIEYRTFAHLSRSERLLKAYQDDPLTDFHEWTGALVRSHRPDFDRKRLKIFNFMLLFGGGIGATADLLGITEEEGKELRTVYFKVFPEAQDVMRAAMRVANDRGYVKTITGRRARFPEAKRLHAALNRAVSGSAADLNKMKLRTLYRERKALGLKLRLTVHDEVVGDLEPGRLDAFKRVMDEQETQLRVPILWSSVIAKNWAEAK
jgi:DNA polymerase-1